MLRRLKLTWHKAKALSALQNYFGQPLTEPLPAEVDRQLRALSERALNERATPIDTALRYYRQLAFDTVLSGQSLDSIGFYGVLGRMFALRDQMKFYREHHEALTSLGEKK